MADVFTRVQVRTLVSRTPPLPPLLHIEIQIISDHLPIRFSHGQLGPGRGGGGLLEGEGCGPLILNSSEWSPGQELSQVNHLGIPIIIWFPS